MTGYFDGLWGHDSVKAILENAIETEKIGHAYIFCGPAGVGKRTAAGMFARAALGTSKMTHPDIITVSNEWCGVESKSDSILTDTINEMRSDIYIKPYGGGRKFYIVPKGDTMNTASQNKLLKVFEEPPAYCTIILIAENLNRFLPTILSRASVIVFSALPENIVARYLEENCGMSADEAAVRAVISGGSIGSAKALKDDPEPERPRNAVIDGLVSLLEDNNKNMILFSNFLKSENNGTDFIFSVLQSFLSDLVHMKLGLEESIVNKDKTGPLRRLAAAVPERSAACMLEIVLKYERVYKTNANFRMTMFCMACELREEIHGRNYRSTI